MMNRVVVVVVGGGGIGIGIGGGNMLSLLLLWFRSTLLSSSAFVVACCCSLLLVACCCSLEQFFTLRVLLLSVFWFDVDACTAPVVAHNVQDPNVLPSLGSVARLPACLSASVACLARRDR